MKKVTAFLKKDPVLAAAWLLALVSAFFVPPDAGWAGYIDTRSLGILWALMVIVQGLQKEGVFERAGEALLNRAKTCDQLAFLLVFLCFFAAMLITNDVVLLTFVPFTILIYRECGLQRRILPVVVLQTIAANLGSMLTPIGNPQNLYLFGKMGLSVGAFTGIVWPYAAASAVMLAVVIWLLPGGREKLPPRGETKRKAPDGNSSLAIALYGVLFVIAVLAVLHVIPWTAAAGAVLVCVFAADRKVLLRADYALLFTFIGFFLFTGNMGRIGPVRDFLQRLVAGREIAAAVLASQAISNVPAALLLSGFAKDLPALLVGVNLGGLGTLIASMASLISWKAFTQAYPGRRGAYLRWFTLANVGFLAVLYGLTLLI